jgi:hypothetical protein
MRKEPKPGVKDVKKAFSVRLNQLLDDHKAPEKYAGRQVFLAEELKVSQESARKWLEGESIPRKAKILQMAQKWSCRASWLEYGELPKTNDHRTAAFLNHWELMNEAERDGLLLLLGTKISKP